MDRRKRFLVFPAGLLLVLALSLLAGFTAFISVAPVSAATFARAWPLVGQGKTGEVVFSVQLMLQAHGASIVIDGVDGPRTTGAVVSFQTAHTLQADGVVGPQT